ncbi:MAG: hypothetical protein HYY45_05150 [Deltaproteobacteria bacterium]|nr:hypothetical protein [Deltaproteobacteria bacterium]
MLGFHTDAVGSLLRPPELLQGSKQLAAGAISADPFKEIEDRAVDEELSEAARKSGNWLYLDSLVGDKGSRSSGFRVQAGHGGQKADKPVYIYALLQGRRVPSQ